jgi:hypothetical protein
LARAKRHAPVRFAEDDDWARAAIVARQMHLAAKHVARYAERLCVLGAVAAESDGANTAQARKCQRPKSRQALEYLVAGGALVIACTDGYPSGNRARDITTHYSAPELQELIDAAERVCCDDFGKTSALTLLKKKAVNG